MELVIVGTLLGIFALSPVWIALCYKVPRARKPVAVVLGTLGLAFVASIIVTRCGPDEAEKNRRQWLEDEAACKDELADRSGHTLSERCARIAEAQEARARAEQEQRQSQLDTKLAADAERENVELNRAAGEHCDPKAKTRRERWLTTNVTEDGLTSSPQDEGLRVDGMCSQKLVTRSLDCSDDSIVRVDGGSPWFKEAKKIGFTRIVCREVDRMSKESGVTFKREVERPIELVTGGVVPRSKPN
jgi:hypothetical protein